MSGRWIGGNRREAINWVQNLLLTTRPIAERTVFSALAEGKAVEREDGIHLFEDDEEVRRRARRQVTPIRNRSIYRFHRGRSLPRHHDHRALFRPDFSRDVDGHKAPDASKRPDGSDKE